MYLKRTGFPEDNELLLCTVTNIHYHSVFVSIDEYGKQGMIHISEVSPGRIRNIRDYVKEGKKVVCKVLRVNLEKGHIDLSLRRVNDAQRRQKLNEIKQEQLAENIVQFVGKKNKLEPKSLFQKFVPHFTEDYETLYEFFEDVRDGKASLTFLDKKVVDDFEEVIHQRIKIPEVEIKSELTIRSYQPNGVELIKDAFSKTGQVKGRYVFKYKGAGKYSLMIKAEEYKEAESVLAKLEKSMTAALEKSGSEVSFDRQK